MVVKKEKEEVVMSTAGTTSLAPEGLESGAPPHGVIELSDNESKGLMASFVATANSGPSVPRVTTAPDTSGDWEFARRLSTELNREEIPSDRKFAQKLFVELNREALGTPGDRALVDLVSDDEGGVATSTGEVAEEVAPDAGRRRVL